MKPFDPRLLKYARETRTYIIFLVLLGLAVTALIATQTLLIGAAATPVFYRKADFADVQPLIWALIGVFALRAALTYVQNALGHRSAVKVIARLREQVLRHAGDLGQRWLADGNAAKIVTQTTRGLDDLEAYFVSFLPELFLCVTATPLLLIVIYALDWVSALAITLCIPLIPIFMVLIGKMTAHFSSQRLKAMELLGVQLLDLLSGLTTLKALGREQGPKARVQMLGRRFADKTMQTLYVAFLSGAALEFIATLSTAIVAVEVGFRMVAGNLLLFEGLVIIMLTPEVFKPLREVGTQFHASSNGIAAAGEAFAVLEIPLPQHTGTLDVPDLRHATIEFENLSVYAPGRATVAPARLNAKIEPGSIAVLQGASGSGKSTTVNALLGLLAPDEGRILVGGHDLSTISREQWWSHITWVPQRPAIVPGTVAENMGLDGGEWLSSAESRESAAGTVGTAGAVGTAGCDTRTTGDAAQLPADLVRACEITGFDAVVASLPAGWNTRVGQGGVGLSVGQRQRLALTRALISTAELIILDEPSAHLDAMSEEYVARALAALKANHHTVVVIAHRAAIAAQADVLITVESSTRDISEQVENARRERAARLAKLREEAQQLDYALPGNWRSTPSTTNAPSKQREPEGFGASSALEASAERSSDLEGSPAPVGSAITEAQASSERSER
ncbi:MAG: ABC transporter ATP-binding protein/permease [Actinomycetaceae bacterium]|nr:ABC transporter ATP-binding protein/permease [Actinomycetaceae bacterium]MDY5854656.1 ABC transporter ATP-binding protein/permease [Arcanobacterium sp.]